jgi:hypothetical protein
MLKDTAGSTWLPITGQFNDPNVSQADYKYAQSVTFSIQFFTNSEQNGTVWLDDIQIQ